MIIPPPLAPLYEFFQGIILGGITVRIMFCLTLWAAQPDEADTYKTRAKHAFYFLVLSGGIMGFVQLIQRYFS